MLQGMDKGTMNTEDNEGREPALVEFNDALVRVAGVDVLHVDSLRIEAGESVAILGPNGAGKSTFIKLITREAAAYARENPPVLFCGRPRISLEELRQTVGIVSSSMQEQIFVHLPAIEIVLGGFYGSLGVPGRFDITDDQRERAMEVMEGLGIASLANRDMETLSTGQARRVLFARALVNDPRALILDEPCAGLDPQGMYYVHKLMRALADEGRAIILVTHQPQDIIEQIDRVILLKGGRVVADGAKADILTDARMSELFDVPLHVEYTDGQIALLEE
jgi:iron complex transport system ATP-binding protein